MRHKIEEMVLARRELCVGPKDVFGVGAMAGGWDEVKLAAMRMPTSGHLDIILTIYGVGHSRSAAGR